MKKLLAVMLAGILCVSIAACGEKKEDTAASDAAQTTEETAGEAAVEETADAESADAAAESTDAAVKTVTEGVLTMGTNAAFPPYEFYEGDVIVGIDAEIAQALAEKLGLELEIVDMDFSSIITSVQTGKIDMGLAGMTVTEERLQNVDFTDSYATGVQVIIVKEDSDIQSVDDMTGKMIGTQEGTTGYQYCSDTPENGGFGEENVIAYTNGATAVQALQQGKVDCVVIDKQPALSFVEANEGLKILDTEYVTEDYAAAVSKENPELRDALNQALTELKEDGTIQSILDKYIKAE